MMASAALAVLAWCVVGTASAADYLATPSNFNRTVYGMSPGLRFSGDVAGFENDNAPMRSDNQRSGPYPSTRRAAYPSDSSSTARG